MKDTITIAPDADITAPADPDWAIIVGSKAAESGNE
jgi:hypothetical protein